MLKLMHCVMSHFPENVVLGRRRPKGDALAAQEEVDLYPFKSVQVLDW